MPSPPLCPAGCGAIAGEKAQKCANNVFLCHIKATSLDPTPALYNKGEKSNTWPEPHTLFQGEGQLRHAPSPSSAPGSSLRNHTIAPPVGSIRAQLIQERHRKGRAQKTGRKKHSRCQFVKRDPLRTHLREMIHSRNCHWIC